MSLITSIINDEPDYDCLSAFSRDATQFIMNCLNKNVSLRQTTEELLDSSWIVNHQPTGELSSQTIINYGKNLATFCQTTPLQTGVCSLLANLLTKAEDLSELSALFKKWDSNNDGYLSFEELEENMNAQGRLIYQMKFSGRLGSPLNYLTQFYALDEEAVRDMLMNADANKDGRLDYTEFVTAAFNKDKLLDKNNLDTVFKVIDTNNDGQISREELQSVFGTAQLEEGF